MQPQNQKVLTALPVAVLLATSGCSTQPPSAAQASIPSLPFSVVATGDSAADIRNASTFTWAQRRQQAGAAQATEDASIDTLLQAAISDTLQAKGYRYSTIPDEGDLVVSYHVALDDTLPGREPPDTNDIQLQPSLNINSPDPARYEKGTLVIELTDKSTGLTAWRSALQGFAVRDLGATERRQRVGLMVDRMLAGVPAK